MAYRTKRRLLPIAGLLLLTTSLLAQTSPPGQRFRDNGDGTVTDALTGLMWERKPSTGRLSWKEALAYCDALVLGGYADWRVPTTMEMERLSEVEGEDSVAWLNSHGFSDVQVDYYWSSEGFPDGILVCMPGACDPPGSGLVWAVRSAR